MMSTENLTDPATPCGSVLDPALRFFGLLLLATMLATAQAQDQEGNDVETPVSAIDAAIFEADDLIAAGDHESAIAVLEQALTAADPDDHIGRSVLHDRLAIGHFYRRDTEGIREHAETAIQLVADDPDAREEYADALGARALYLGESGKTQAYLEASQTELAVRRELPPARSEVSIPLINIAIAHGESGDFEAAERYLREALDYALEHETDTTRPTMIRSNLAWVYGMRKDYRAAARMLQAVIETAREKQPGSVILANRLTNLGSVLASLERYEEAQEALEEARLIQLEQIPDSLDLGRTTYALAQVAKALDDAARAAPLYQEAIDLVDAQTPNASVAAFPRRALAGVLIDRDELDPAEALLEQARALTSLTNNPGQHASTLFQIGRLNIAQEDRDAARRHWQAAIDALEVQYDMLGGSALTLAGFSQAYQPLYRGLAQLYIDAGEYSEAIRLLESYRNRALLERIDVNRLLRQSKVGVRLLADLGELQSRARETATSAAESESGDATPVERLAELRRQRRDQVAAAARQQPQLADLLEDAAARESSMRVPDEDGRILYYSLGERRSDLLVVSAKGVVAHRLPPAAEIATLVERFRILVQRPEADPAPLAEVTRRLHQILLAPAQAELAGARTLLIRADGPLLLLPFAALRDDNSAYLVERYRIQRLHTLNQTRDAVNDSDRADSSYSGFAYAGDGNERPGLRGERAPLRHVDDEIARAAALFGDRAEQHIGPAATETRARRIDSRRILHFASHAVVDPVEPLSSYISLAADPHNDGQLELWEIMADLSLDGGLVVLSACETALGPSFAGEGLFGLAKGFAFAGADTVMATLWAIDDASTMHLTETFYRELTAGRTPAEALNRAQKGMLAGDIPARGLLSRLWGSRAQRDYSHPYYWASFTLTATR